jgi:hypothetical protein
MKEIWLEMAAWNWVAVSGQLAFSAEKGSEFKTEYACPVPSVANGSGEKVEDDAFDRSSGSIAMLDAVGCSGLT